MHSSRKSLKFFFFLYILVMNIHSIDVFSVIFNYTGLKIKYLNKLQQPTRSYFYFNKSPLLSTNF